MTLHTDLPIPRVSDILDRALDIRQIAVHRADDATVRQLDRLIEKLPFAKLCWQLGTLLVSSPSGGHYRVSRAGCSCLNAQRSGKRQCWHVVLHELLLDLFETEVVTLDMEAEARPLGARVAAARQLIWASL
jgi:hypothetical protein